CYMGAERRIRMTQAASDSTGGRSRAVRLLLVDDNVDTVELLSEILTALGYVVGTAFDGPSALMVAKDFLPEVALLNIGLPVMDGYELGRKLRDLHQPLRVIALTGYGNDSHRTRSFEAGFDAHLVKPVEVDELHRTIHRSLALS
ncbi:MAG TPA: response regulator, partial [Polyangiales bacterium]|nr:response regulator [Polyangiales bacterium]